MDQRFFVAKLQTVQVQGKIGFMKVVVDAVDPGRKGQQAGKLRFQIFPVIVKVKIGEEISNP